LSPLDIATLEPLARALLVTMRRSRAVRPQV